MVIAVEKGLKAHKAYLAQLGHVIVPLKSPGRPIDAAVYEKESLAALSFPDACYGAQNVAGGSTGILLVNAKNRSPADVAHILNQKGYGNLF